MDAFTTFKNGNALRRENQKEIEQRGVCVARSIGCQFSITVINNYLCSGDMFLESLVTILTVHYPPTPLRPRHRLGAGRGTLACAELPAGPAGRISDYCGRPCIMIVDDPVC